MKRPNSFHVTPCHFLITAHHAHPHQDRFTFLFSGSLGQRSKSHMPSLTLWPRIHLQWGGGKGLAIPTVCCYHVIFCNYWKILEFLITVPFLWYLWTDLSSCDRSFSLGPPSTLLCRLSQPHVELDQNWKFFDNLWEKNVSVLPCPKVWVSSFLYPGLRMRWVNLNPSINQ